MRQLPTAVLFAVLTSACASVPMAPPKLDMAAKEFKATPGKTNLYVFRDEGIGGAVRMSVLLDGKLLGDTAAKTFLLTTVEPGAHVLVSKAENDSRLDFTAQPGKNVFVWQEVKMGIMSARSKLQVVDEATAKGRVNSCKLAETTPPPPAAAAAKPAPVPAS
jgi:hypothetical protein